MWPFSSVTRDERAAILWGDRWCTFSVEGTGQRKDADIECAKVLAKAARRLRFPVFVVQHRPYPLSFHDGWYHGTVDVRVLWPVGGDIDPMLSERHRTGSVADYIQYLVPFMNRTITEMRVTDKIREWYWWGGTSKNARIWRVNLTAQPDKYSAV
jgi:hypothetical protein